MTRLDIIKRAFLPNTYATMPHQVPPAEQAKAVRFAQAYDTVTAAYLFGVSRSRVCMWLREAGAPSQGRTWGTLPARNPKQAAYRRAA